MISFKGENYALSSKEVKDFIIIEKYYADSLEYFWSKQKPTYYIFKNKNNENKSINYILNLFDLYGGNFKYENGIISLETEYESINISIININEIYVNKRINKRKSKGK